MLSFQTLFLKTFVHSQHPQQLFGFSVSFLSLSVCVCVFDVVVWLFSKAFISEWLLLGLILTHWLSAYTLWSTLSYSNYSLQACVCTIFLSVHN